MNEITEAATVAKTANGYPKDIYIAELREMIEADAQHLAAALANGERVNCLRLVNSIIDNQQELEDQLA